MGKENGKLARARSLISSKFPFDMVDWTLTAILQTHSRRLISHQTPTLAWETQSVQRENFNGKLMWPMNSRRSHPEWPSQIVPSCYWRRYISRLWNLSNSLPHWELQMYTPEKDMFQSRKIFTCCIGSRYLVQQFNVKINTIIPQ